MNAAKTPYFLNHLLQPTVSLKYKEHITAICKNSTRLLLVVYLIFTSLATFSQKNDSLQPRQQDIVGPQQDTISNGLNKQLKQLGFSEVKKGMRKFEEDRIETKQDELIESIQKTMLAATNYIEIGIDTTGLNDEQADIEVGGLIADCGGKTRGNGKPVLEKIYRRL